MRQTGFRLEMRNEIRIYIGEGVRRYYMKWDWYKLTRQNFLIAMKTTTAF